jgi:hypothetical protein
VNLAGASLRIRVNSSSQSNVEGLIVENSKNQALLAMDGFNGNTSLRGTLSVQGGLHGDLGMNDYSLRLRSPNDENHALRYVGDNRFSRRSLDGPALYGKEGGFLGTNVDGNESIQVEWDTVCLTVRTRLVVGNDFYRTAAPLLVADTMDMPLNEDKTPLTGVVVSPDMDNGCGGFVPGCNSGVLKTSCRTLGQASEKYGNNDPIAKVSADFAASILVRGAVCSTSDRRLKDHEQDINREDALAALEKLHPVEYRRRDKWEETARKNAPVEAGFYAQELAEHLPHAVQIMPDAQSPDGLHWRMQHDQLHAYTVAAIQALSSQVRELREELASLKRDAAQNRQ